MTILDKSGSTSGKNSTPFPMREYKNCIQIKTKIAEKITLAGWPNNLFISFAYEPVIPVSSKGDVLFSEDKRIAVLDFFLTGAFNELLILLIKGIRNEHKNGNLEFYR